MIVTSTGQAGPGSRTRTRISPKLALFALLMLTATLTLSCATILKGPYELLTISSNPGGAEVTIDGSARVGQTPITLALVDSRFTHTIQLRLDGYQDATIVLGHHLGAGWLLLDIFLTGFVGLIVDGVTGDWMMLDANLLHVEMQPSR
ncbi:MAG: PEGA domain-containing protein [Planctomycetota bacterium]